MKQIQNIIAGVEYDQSVGSDAPAEATITVYVHEWEALKTAALKGLGGLKDVEICSLCKGTGTINKDYWSQDADDCPQCGAIGFLFSPALIALIVSTINHYAPHDFIYRSDWYVLGVARSIAKNLLEHWTEE